MYGDWTHASVGAGVAALRECWRGFELPRRARHGKRIRIYPGSIVVVLLCALVAWLFDHSLLTSAGIGSLGLDVWKLLGRQVESLRAEPEAVAEEEGREP